MLPPMLEPDPPAPPIQPDTPPPAQVYPLPSARKVVASGLQLALAATGDLRRASIYIGLLVLGSFGPAIIAILLIIGRLGDQAGDALGAVFFGKSYGAPPQPALEAALLVVAIEAFVGVALFLTISIDAQIMAIAILGGRASERPLRLWEAIIRARQTFWRMAGAGAVVGVVSLLAQGFLTSALGGYSRSVDAASITAGILATIVVAPLAYVASSIVLGDVGAMESLSRSWRLFKARRLLAVVVVLFTFVTSAIQLFALSSGLDLVIRASELLHVSLTEGALAFGIAIVLILAAVVAYGSLTFTIGAIVAAPQVAGFLGLTFFSGGLDRARVEGPKPPRAFRYVSRPMAIAMVALAGIVALEIPAINSIPTPPRSAMLELVREKAAAESNLIEVSGYPAILDDRPGDVTGPVVEDGRVAADLDQVALGGGLLAHQFQHRAAWRRGDRVDRRDLQRDDPRERDHRDGHGAADVAEGARRLGALHAGAVEPAGEKRQPEETRHLRRRDDRADREGQAPVRHDRREDEDDRDAECQRALGQRDMEQLRGANHEVQPGAQREELDRRGDEREQHDHDREQPPRLEEPPRARQRLHGADVAKHDAAGHVGERRHDDRGEDPGCDARGVHAARVAAERACQEALREQADHADDRTRAGHPPEGLARADDRLPEPQRALARAAAEDRDRHDLGVDRDREEQRHADESLDRDDEQRRLEGRLGRRPVALAEEDGSQRVAGLVAEPPDDQQNGDDRGPERPEDQQADVDRGPAEIAGGGQRELESRRDDLSSARQRVDLGGRRRVRLDGRCGWIGLEHRRQHRDCRCLSSLAPRLVGSPVSRETGI